MASIRKGLGMVGLAAIIGGGLMGCVPEDYDCGFECVVDDYIISESIEGVQYDFDYTKECVYDIPSSGELCDILPYLKVVTPEGRTEEYGFRPNSLSIDSVVMDGAPMDMGNLSEFEIDGLKYRVENYLRIINEYKVNEMLWWIIISTAGAV